ncbi:MAG: TonB-dependent receptor plug domain-containing protein [Bacteroidetes bacterium]|nr:TonB-dependent receptor plug domain-containing protein [Bacteroidota bacterium]
MKYLIFIILFINCLNVNSQTVTSDTLKKIPFGQNKILNSTYLSKNSEVFRYDSLCIWNDRRNLSEILDHRPGFFINDFGQGGRNNISFNSSSYYSTGIFRDGIQVNDNFYQGFDIQNLSVNEIDRIEEISATSSFFYGINSSGKVINVITKDFFTPQPFSQFRYSQDRDGSLSADIFLSQPVSRKVSVMAGITKHSLDGRYLNSEFNVWRGRARVNLYFSSDFNIRFDLSLSNFDRGLNEGLQYTADKDSLADPLNAKVINSVQKENLENYFSSAQFTGKFFRKKDWVTKVKIYSNNSIRDLYNPADTGSVNIYSGYQHSIAYGGELLQNISINYGKNYLSDLTLGFNIYSNILNGNITKFLNSLTDPYQNSRDLYYSLRAKYDLRYSIFSASALVRNDNLAGKNYLNAGAEATVKAISTKKASVNFSAGIRRSEYFINNASETYVNAVSTDTPISDLTNNLINGGIKFRYTNSEFEFVYSTGKNAGSDVSVRNINAGYNFISQYFDISLNYNNSNSELFPEHYIKSDIAYKNILFRGKLKLRTGFDFKYYNIRNITFQDQTLYSYSLSSSAFPLKDQFITDFYIGARIGRANINLTVANIFNSLVYNTYLFPLYDRGGFLNAISRFTIVWDFIN